MHLSLVYIEVYTPSVPLCMFFSYSILVYYVMASLTYLIYKAIVFNKTVCMYCQISVYPNFFFSETFLSKKSTYFLFFSIYQGYFYCLHLFIAYIVPSVLTFY